MNKVIILDEINYQKEIILKNESKNNLIFIDLIQESLNFNLDIRFAYNSECEISLFSLNNNNIKDFTLNMHHSTDKGISDTNIYVVNQGTGHTKAKIMSIVKRDTDLNETYQNIRAINLGNKSKFTGEPMLSVDNNNIKAKHEMSVGQINDDQLFYLMSRGISKENSKKLVILGHFKKIIDKLEVSEANKYTDYMKERLGINEN